MSRGPNMGQLKRATRQLGVSSTALRQQGWKTASAARVKAAQDDPPEWLIEARERRRKMRDQQQRRRDCKDTATRLRIQVRAATEHDIKPSEVEGLLAARPDWMIMEQERRLAQIEREATDQLRRELADTLVTSVHEEWLQELKHRPE
jgi:hypothetical protein